MNGQAVYTLIRHGDKLLFVLREHTGFMDGLYSLPAGRVEPGEVYTVGAARETLEEVGLTVNPDNLSFVYMQHRAGEQGSEYSLWTDVFFEAADYKGDPMNAEPEKHSAIAWFYADELPDNLMPFQRYALERIAEGKLYGEYTPEQVAPQQ